MIEQKGEKELKELKIIYYLNDFDGKECSIKFDTKKEYITYKELIEKFFHYLKSITNENSENQDENFLLIDFDIISINDIFFEYIRYYQYEGWILLKENEIIDFNENYENNKINIIIKASIITKDNLVMKSRYDIIQKEMNNISTNINNEIRNNLNINEIRENNNNNIFDIIILISNPLMDKEKELRSMNDYNNIANSIKDIFSQSIKSINAQFLPLTKDNFISSISSKKPIILHLICKSTYIFQENNKNNYKNSSDCTYLIFETKDFNTEFINKEELVNIFKSKELKENIKYVNLIISTPLSKDVYEIFKVYEFKNILVQHTTLADIDFISKFNYTFYEYIIENNNCDIYNAYLTSLYQNNYANNSQFCCCFHQHDINPTCNIINNSRNELYLKNEMNLHFNHLNFNCECNKLYKNFCNHFENCENLNKINNSNNNCCCKKKNKHNLEVIFSKSFKEQKNPLNDNNKNLINIGTNYNMTLKMNLDNIPNYEKMKLLVGKNRIIFETMNFLINQDIEYNKLNIYNDEMINLKQLAEIIIEYYKERFNLNNFIQYDIKGNEDLKKFDNNNICLKDRNKFFYFIFIHDIKLIDKENLFKFGNKNKFVFYSKKEILIDDIHLNRLKIENLSENDYYIKYQNEKIKYKSEKSFKENILSKIKNISI